MVENRRRWQTLVAGVALGITVLGATGPSVTLAQQDDVVVGGAVDDAFVESLIEQIFAEVFGGDVSADDADASAEDINVGGSTGGDINVGGNMGGSVTMGGGSGGSVDMGGGSGGDISIGGGYSGS